MLDNYYYFFLKRPKTVYADFHMCTLCNKKKKKRLLKLLLIIYNVIIGENKGARVARQRRWMIMYEK